MIKLDSLLPAFVFALLAFVAAASRAYAQEEGSTREAGDTSEALSDSDLPRVKFFYFESEDVEWSVSDDPKAYDEHLGKNEASRKFVKSLHDSVQKTEDPERARTQMTSWIAEQRNMFERRSTRVNGFRRAEGIVAYLRAHDFSMRRLVRSLKRRSGASNVQLVAVHLKKGDSNPEFMLKVVLESATIDIGQMGYNVDLGSPDISYVTVVFALSRALYEVHELISASTPPEELPSPMIEGAPTFDSAPEPTLSLPPRATT